MIVPMSRLRLAGLKSDYEGVINILTQSKQFEYRTAQSARPDDNSDCTEEVSAKQSNINFAIEYLLKINDEAAELVKKIRKRKFDKELNYLPYKKESVRKLIDFEQFAAVKEKEDRLLSVVEEIKKLSFRQVELRTKQKEWKDKKKEYLPLRGFPLLFSDAGKTARTVSELYFSRRRNATIELPELAECELFETDGGTVAYLISLDEGADEASAAMAKAGFARLNYTEGSVDSLIEECDKSLQKIDEEMYSLLLEGLSYEEYTTELMILYDLLGIRLDQSEALNGSFTTKYTFILDGWIPEKSGQSITEKISQNYTVYASLTPADPADDPPTLISNNALVEPFENITKMYTVPAYTEKDPNAHMAIWYFILFGVMCGDVVYGLMLTLGCFLLLRFKKFEKGTASMIKMFGICGISSALWGIAFDSYLGFGVGFGWFVPMEKPMLLLGLSLVLGILQIAYGYILGVVRCIRERNPMGAIFDMGLMLLVLVAISLLTADIFTGIFSTGEFDMNGKFLPENISAIFGKTGLILLLVAVVGIFFTAGRASKSIGGKIGNGLYGVYGLVNLISDILSYCRLFGLGLAGGAIAYAFNTLMDTIFFSSGNAAGFIIGAVLTLVLHVFNLAISLLGAYVHNARLQMLEFYGKFLVGDGREFSYIGQSTKYVIYK